MKKKRRKVVNPPVKVVNPPAAVANDIDPQRLQWEHMLLWLR